MKRFVVGLTVAVSFAVGFAISPALATSYPGAYAKIYGHSTSCALGRASVNNDTDRAGAFTANFQGCSSSNARRSVPANYLGARAFVYNYYNGAVCGQSSLYWNSTTASSRDASTGRESYANGCDSPGNFFGRAHNYRKTDSDGTWYLNDRVSPAVYFDTRLT